MASKIRSKSLLVALFAFLVCLPAISARAEVTSNTQTPISGSVFDPCTGDTVSFTVDVHVVTKMTTDSNGGIHGSFSVNIDNYDATGTPSGDSYTAHFNQTGTANFTSGGTFESSFVFTADLVSAGSTDNAQTIMVLHITINPDGTVTANVSNVTVRCVG